MKNQLHIDITHNRIPGCPPPIESIIDSNRPLWSVMIPVYNCYPFIKTTLQSVLMQAPNQQLMQIEVVDDCSTDGDVERLVQDIGKGRVTYYRQKKNCGSLRNFETCINRSKGEHVHLLHGDDKVEDGFYEEIGHLFRDYPTAGAAFTNYNFIDGEGGLAPIKNESISKNPGIIPNFISKIAVKQIIQPPAMVVKRSTYEELGSFFAAHFGEDWEMWARIGSKFPVAYSPKYLASYRITHGGGISHNSYRSGQNIKDIKKIIDIIQRYLPINEQPKLKKAALANYAQYCVKVGNGLMYDNRSAALKQVKGAWSMNKNIFTLYMIIRFYAMYIFRYKQLEHWLQFKIRNRLS